MAARSTLRDDLSSDVSDNSAALERLELLFNRLLIDSHGNANAKDEDGLTLLQHASIGAITNS